MAFKIGDVDNAQDGRLLVLKKGVVTFSGLFRLISTQLQWCEDQNCVDLN